MRNIKHKIHFQPEQEICKVFRKHLGDTIFDRQSLNIANLIWIKVDHRGYNCMMNYKMSK